LVEQWLRNRTEGPLFLKAAVARAGVDAVVACAIALGVSKNVIMFTLRSYGCMPAPPRDPDPFYTKVKKLWRKDKARLMALVEEFYRGE
jgi:hypothetical protein